MLKFLMGVILLPIAIVSVVATAGLIAAMFNLTNKENKEKENE